MNTEKKTHNRFKFILAWTGWLGFSTCIALFCVTSCSTNNTMNDQSTKYHKANKAAQTDAATLSEAEAKIALDRFTNFLEGIGSAEFVRKETQNVYAESAYLNDTLKSLSGSNEIEEHFLNMADVMTTYSVKTEDISKSEQGYYLRWTMKFSAPKLASGKEIVSIGMSHVVFDKDGKVLLHQDFWDSTSGMFEHLPVLGGGIRFVKKRL